MPGVRLTYAQLAERALDVARGLMACGVKGGDHVATLLTTPHTDWLQVKRGYKPCVG
ncbi:MAG: hypothetical protein EBS89_04925 [Proteobacteria bacterium]|nr:hypothetical protein [Pseudomonadota bacterium]